MSAVMRARARACGAIAGTARRDNAGASLTIPWFDQNGHPFVPTCRAAERRAQRMSPRRGRSEAERRALARLTERARRYPRAPKTKPKITPERA